MKNAIWIKDGSTRKIGYFSHDEYKLSKLSGEKHTGFWLDRRIINVVNILRFYYGKPLKFNSVGRTPAYNAQTEGSAPLSYHQVLDYRPVSAIDVDVASGSAADLKKLREIIVAKASILKAFGLRGVGFYTDHRTFIHLDTGGDTFHTWSYGGAMSAEQKRKLESAKPAKGAQLASVLFSPISELLVT